MRVGVEDAVDEHLVAVDVDEDREERDEGARASLLDLLDDWGLPRAEGDDVIVTSRTYSVYEKDMPGFDGEE